MQAACPKALLPSTYYADISSICPGNFSRGSRPAVFTYCTYPPCYSFTPDFASPFSFYPDISNIISRNSYNISVYKRRRAVRLPGK